MNLLNLLLRLWFPCFLVAVVANWVCADDTLDSRISYRRIYAPVDRLADWPRGNAMYKPMDAAAFERWASGEEVTKELPQITQATFSAMLEGEDTLAGKMSFQIDAPSEETHALPLTPCGVALADLEWEQGEERTPARIGSDAEGRLFLFVSGSGTLRGNWSVRGKPDRVAQLDFQFLLPPSITKEFDLQLPEGLEPNIANAVVSAPVPVSGDLHTWNLQLPGQTDVHLRILKESTDSTDGLNLIKQSLAYDFRSDRLQLDQELSLNIYRKPVKQLALAMDRELRLTQAFLGDQPIEWLEQDEADAAEHKVVLQLPEPVVGSDRVVRLRAIASPLYDRRWTIPRIKAEGFSWKEGVTSLIVAEPLVVEQMRLIGCQQLRAGKVPGGIPSEIFEIQDHGPDAEVEVVLISGGTQGEVDSVSSFFFSDGAINGRMVCDVRLGGPAQFKLKANVHPGWNIESVVARNSGVIERWRQEEAEAGNLVTIFLRRGTSASRPLRLEITGRKSRPVPKQLVELKKLHMLQFEGMRSGRELFELAARDPYRIRVTRAADFKGFSWEELMTEDQDRVKEDFSVSLRGEGQGQSLDNTREQDSPISDREESRSRFWYDSSQMQQMEIRIEKPLPRFSTETRIETQLGEAKISEQSVIECTPQESGIDALQIVFSESRDSPIECSVVDQNGVVLDGVRASRISSPPDAGSETGEAWMVRWNRPLSQKFQLIINRTTGFKESVKVALLSVPQAFEQRATVAVLGGLGHHVAVINRGLKAIPIQEGSHFVPNPMRARYRYDPERDVRGNGDRGLDLVRQPTDIGSALIWREVAESWFAPTGEGIHRVTYYLENEGRGFFTASLQQGNQFRSAEVDGVQVRLPPAGTNLPLNIALPENQRFSVVELQWNTPFVGGWLPWIRQVSLPLPKIKIPVISRDRIIHAPPGFVTTDSLSGVGSDRVGLSWQQRLFGPLARMSFESVFDPFDFYTWSNIPLVTVDDVWRQRSKAEEILQRIGRVLAAHPETAAWGDLAQIDQTANKMPAVDSMSLFVDLNALAAVGIGPETPIQVYSERSPRRMAIEALRKANLVVAFNAQRLVLSTVESLQPADAAWLIEGVVCRLDRRNGIFADPSSINLSLLPLSDWGDDVAIAEFPWKAVWRDGFDVTENQGGSTLYLDDSQANLSEVQLIDVEALRGLQWTLFTVIALAGCLWGPVCIRKGVVCLLCLGIAALILPAMLAPLATAAFCAGVFAFLWHRFYPLRQVYRSKINPTRSKTSDLDSATRTMRVTGSELLLLFLSVTLTLSGFSVLRLHAAPRTDIPPAVVIPIDSNNRKVGDTYYLSAALFDAVHQDAATEKSAFDWLMTDARYRFVFNWNEDRSQISTEYCVARIQIEVLGHHALIELPFGSGEADRSKFQLTVDGKVPDDLQQLADTGFAFVVDEPGIYFAELRMPVITDEVGGMRRIDCSIPALATSSLEIDFPAGAVPPNVLSAKGSVHEDQVRNRLRVQLGDADRMVLQWQEDEAIASSGLHAVDQLAWMKVQPGAVVVDARFKLNIEDRRVQRVQIETDSELRLLSPLEAKADGDGLELTHVRTVAGDPQTIELQWSPGITGEVEIRVPFLWAGVSGVGNIRLPQLRVKGSRDTRRWVGISVDPALFVDRDLIPRNNLLKPLSVTALGGIWDLANEAPDFFYEQNGSVIDWALPTRLQESETIGFAKLMLGVSDAVSNVVAEYELETTDGHRCQYQVELPAGFVPDHVEMKSDNVDSLLRWSVHKDADADRLTLFLSEPVRGTLKLMIRGRLLHSKASFHVPYFVLKDVRMRGGQVAIYRGPKVRVQLEGGPEAWQQFDDFVPMAETPLEFGRFVGVYRLPLESLRQQVTVVPNRINAEAIQVVSLNRIDAQWNVEVDLRIKMHSGQLDTIRFRVPEGFQGPFQMEPEVPFLVKRLPVDDGFVLDVRPPKSIDDSYRLTFRGTLNIDPESPVRCPVISIEEIDRVSRFVVLPKKVDFQDVSWKTAGLVSQSLPEDSENAPLADTSVASFKVIDHTYRAVLQSVDQPVHEPKVPLADIDVICNQLDRYVGRAIFDLDPAGLASVGIQLPHPSAELLRIRVDDRPTNLRKVKNGWDIELHSRNLPQRVEVLYSAPYAIKDTLYGVARPFLTASGEKIPIVHTLWSLLDSHQFGPLPIYEDQRLAIRGSMMQFECLQKRARNLLDALVDVTSAEPVEVLLPWYTRTVRHLISTQQEMENILPHIPTESLSEFMAKQDLLAEQVSDVASQLISQGVFPSIDAFRQIGSRGADPWEGFISRPATLVGSESDQATLFIGRPSSGAVDFPTRWLLAILAMGVIASIGLRPQVAENLLRIRIPLLPILFAIAMFYWLFLSPSIFGFLAMLTISVLALVFPWNWVVGEVSQFAESSEV